MKKLFFICFALLAVSVIGKAQLFKFQTSTYTPETYYLTVADTNVFTKADMIAGFTIDAIDTVRIKGPVTSLKSGGIASDFVKINPGESKGFGFLWDVRLDSVTIINDGKAQYWITRVKR
jgi:hypothetical protein